MPAEPPMRKAPPPLTRADWGLILVLVLIQFTHVVDFVIIMPLGGRLMHEFDIGTEQYGLVVAAYTLASAAAGLLVMPLLDRFDRRAALLVMYAGFAVSTFLCGLAPTYGWLLAGRALAGVCGGLAAVVLMAVVGDVFPPEKRGRAIGAITSAFAVASIAGLPPGLYLAEAFGWGAPFLVLGGLSVGVWVFAWAKLPSVRGHLVYPRRHPAREFWDVVRPVNHRRAFAFSFVLAASTFMVASFVAPYLKAVNGWSEATLGHIYMAAGAFTLAGMTVVGRLADRVPRRPLFGWLAAGAVVTMVICTNLPATPTWVAAVAVSAFMVFASGRMIPAQAILIGAAEPRLRGTFMGVNTAVQHAAIGVAPLVAGVLLTRTADGQLHHFPLVGLVAAAAVVVSVMLAGAVRPATITPPVEPRHDEPEAELEPTAAAV